MEDKVDRSLKGLMRINRGMFDHTPIILIIPIAPTIISMTLSNVTANSVTLTGQVNPNNSNTVVTFQYGITSNYGSEITAVQSPLVGTGNKLVSVIINNLTPNTNYCYRVKTVNSVGTTYGTNTIITTLVTPTNPIIPTYVSSDFGENAINNHNSSDAGHSEKVQVIFNYVTRAFRDRCTSFQTYNNTFLGYSLLCPENLLMKSDAVDSDILFTPYVNAARWLNGEYYDFVLPIGSHYDNNGQHGEIDNNRHDITVNAETLLINSVAVSARRDTPSEFMKSTSFGYGMEFFEDCSPEGLDADYPDRDIPIAFAEVRTSVDGYTMYGNRTMDMNTNTRLVIGDTIKLINGNLIENRIIASILPNGTYTVTVPFTPYVVTEFITIKAVVNGTLTKIGEVGTEENGILLRAHNIKNTDFTLIPNGSQVTLVYPDLHEEVKVVASTGRYDILRLTVAATQYVIPGIYVWYNDTLGYYVYGQAQSWAVPLVAGKLKVIKMTTMADWDTVRAAARATAKRNPTGIPEIDNTNWDMYRGFGCIQVQAAINYINNL